MEAHRARDQRLAQAPAPDADRPSHSPDYPGGTGPEALVFLTPSCKAVRHTLFVARVFKPAIAAAVPHKAHLRWHDLRHTCATLLIAAGAHAKLVQERLGHASITATLNLYGHVLPSAEPALVEQMDALYASTSSGR